MTTLKARLRFNKETKGALQFQEIDAGGIDTIEVLGGLYLRKTALGTIRPKRITIEIKVEE